MRNLRFFRMFVGIESAFGLRDHRVCDDSVKKICAGYPAVAMRLDGHSYRVATRVAELCVLSIYSQTLCRARFGLLTIRRQPFRHRNSLDGWGCQKKAAVRLYRVPQKKCKYWQMGEISRNNYLLWILYWGVYRQPIVKWMSECLPPLLFWQVPVIHVQRDQWGRRSNMVYGKSW